MRNASGRGARSAHGLEPTAYGGRGRKGQEGAVVLVAPFEEERFLLAGGGGKDGLAPADRGRRLAAHPAREHVGVPDVAERILELPEERGRLARLARQLLRELGRVPKPAKADPKAMERGR